MPSLVAPAPFDVCQAVLDGAAKEITTYPCHVNRASEIGHPCVRHCTYTRTNWQDRQLISPETKLLFEGGTDIEARAIKQLERAGYEVMHQQRPLEYKDAQITGHIDFTIRHDGAQYPTEVKGLNHYDWDKIDSVDDLVGAKKPWLRKYPAQLQLYMLMQNRDIGLFYVLSKLTYRPKALWMTLDYDYAEGLLKKAEQVNAHVAAGTLPDRIDFEEATCGRCDFRHICLPDFDYGAALELMDDSEFEDMLKRRADLSPAVKEYEVLDKQIKKLVTGKEKLVCGNFFITGKTVERKGFTVADSSYWRVSITKLKDGAA